MHLGRLSCIFLRALRKLRSLEAYIFKVKYKDGVAPVQSALSDGKDNLSRDQDASGRTFKELLEKAAREIAKHEVSFPYMGRVLWISEVLKIKCKYRVA